jgi:hypothetical protein
VAGFASTRPGKLKTMNTKLKTAIFAAISPELTSHGFLLKLAKDRFVRRRGEVSDFFQLVCLDGKPGYRIQPNVGVRLEQVEHIFHQASGIESKYQKDTPTMGSSIGMLLTGDSRSCEFLVESGSDVAMMAGQIVGTFHEFAMPYYERWGSLIAIDAELNSKPSERSHHRPLAWQRCSTAIIAAKLVGRPDYDQLAGFYTEVMKRDNKGFHLGRFQALLMTLKSIEGGSSLTGR